MFSGGASVLKISSIIGGMPSQSIYIDTDMLIYYFDNRSNDKGRISRETIKKILSNLGNAEIRVRISQVVLGELLVFFCIRKQDKCSSGDMINLLKELKADYPSGNLATMDCAQELMRGQSIKPNDAMIAAHALLDRSTQWLLTTDQTLITNLEIERQMTELRHRFTIGPNFHLV